MKEVPSASKDGLRCLICQAQATGYHFDAQSCSACAAFFRRTVSLNRDFQCITGREDCQVHYSMHQICRFCRYSKCLSAGMDKKGVQPRRLTQDTGRSFFTKSGLRRNKKFGVVNPVSKEEEAQCMDERVLSGGSCPPSVESSNGTRSRPWSPVSDVKTDEPPQSAKSSTSNSNGTPFASPPIPGVPLPLVQAEENVLDILIREEMRLGEKRRIMFCERPVENLLGKNSNCPFTADDIRPLSFHMFRKSIRTHILWIYEWLQAWPDYAHLTNADQVSFLRKCVLFHTILDPVYISMQIGHEDKFVMQNGGYVSTIEDCEDGWRDEKEISGSIKKMIYKPLLERIMNEIIPPLKQIKITFVEFVALKAFVSWQGAIENVSSTSRPAMNKQLDAVINALHKHYIETDQPAAERLGTIILLLSSIFSTGLEFVERHRQLEFFDLWQLDSLLLQFLNLDAIMQRGRARKPHT